MAIPSRIKQKVGESSRPKVYEIEKGQIRRFASAIGEDNPIHFDEGAAKAAGFSSLVAPPTFLSALCNIDELMEELDLDTQATMHAEEEYEYFRPVCAGDEITVTNRLVDAYDKQAPNGKLLFVVVETRGTDKRSRDVFKGRRVLVELKN